ncbi:head-tail connector protein [Ruegeria sp. HKCCD8929]|uniref:head-tail connector protein n=1 Tax=Ruegeria sp. HKCCD8929 TaxID=2683006 RepID=UPI0014898235|nr:head-tail connector protein [Ruegeria sp. HKCCD8929]
MMLIEETSVPDAALPVDQFKAHLRLGTGFAEDNVQDEVLKSFLRAAIAAIEARTGKVLIAREFSWSLNGWRDRGGEVLPVAPVTGVDAVTLADAEGVEAVVEVGSYRLEPDSQRPRLRPAGALLPAVGTGGSVKIAFTAGMAADWGGLPADLGQAVLLLAAHYYEYRNETALGDGCMPFGVTSLIQRYRMVRFGAGVVQ